MTNRHQRVVRNSTHCTNRSSLITCYGFPVGRNCSWYSLVDGAKVSDLNVWRTSWTGSVWSDGDLDENCGYLVRGTYLALWLIPVTFQTRLHTQSHERDTQSTLHCLYHSTIYSDYIVSRTYRENHFIPTMFGLDLKGYVWLLYTTYGHSTWSTEDTHTHTCCWVLCI